MIHQFIFAAPRPGMTVVEFQDYWANVHAVRFASRIPQIKRYLIDSRLPFEGDWGSPPLPHQGIAEIWMENEEEQLASLQTPEFLQGARRDEPTWAAFWRTLVVDTTAHEILAGPPLTRDPTWVKLTVLLKRRPGMPLGEYRQRSLESHAPIVAGLPGLRRYLHCHTRDGAYVFGEASFDSVEQLFFNDLDTLREALASPYFAQQVEPARAGIVDPKYVFSLASSERWIIGPEAR
ncbi:EthD domain-containing protein [Corallococcus sicarius]|uniref:Ethyl tert-butyl ether degradation protein EthD n=1 Tax=Corallococcus sicarius TaxID=2316726 RepID=A0A3A8NBK8_9BACT|nr:EthD domain-containing protein [Corallococcus sicarius]RKH41373.1 ethyl tert-butyl ether degradation protein EthD [Corallococcus sicarius]